MNVSLGGSISLRGLVLRSLILVSGLGYATFVLSADKAGDIMLVKGEVFILDAASKIVADPSGKRGRSTLVGQPFYVGETVQTKPGARVKLKFIEGGNEVVLGADTSLLVERASTDPNKKGTTLNLSKGEVRSDVKAKYSGKDGDSYEVKTNNAVAGVRGTIFTVLNRGGVSKISLSKGSLVATGAIGKPVVLTPGMMTEARSGAPVSAPKSLALDPEMAKTEQSLASPGGGSESGDNSTSSPSDSNKNSDNASTSKANGDGGPSAAEGGGSSAVNAESKSGADKSTSQAAAGDTGKSGSGENTGGEKKSSAPVASNESGKESSRAPASDAGSGGTNAKSEAKSSSVPLGRETASTASSTGGGSASANAGASTVTKPAIMGGGAPAANRPSLLNGALPATNIVNQATQNANRATNPNTNGQQAAILNAQPRVRIKIE